MKIFYCLVFLLLAYFVRSQSGTWTVMKVGPPSYGTKGVPSYSNEPTASIGCGYWTDTAGNFWIYGGLDANFNFYSSLWVYNQASTFWTWMNGDTAINQPENIAAAQGVYSAANTPGNLGAGIFSWVTANNHFWIYGGGSSGGLTKGDLWQYSPVINQWAWMGSFSNPIWGTKGVGSAANAPGARYEGNSSWKDTLGNLWLFGGYENFGGDYADMWKYNTGTGIWTWVSGADTFESPGVYGALGAPSVNDYPASRSTNLFWTDNSGNFWLSGGYQFDGNGGYYQDIWKFNPYNLQWTWVFGPSTSSGISPPVGVNCQKSAANMQGTRFGNSGLWNLCSDLIFNYGGYYYPHVDVVEGYNDLWAYSPSQNEWEKISETKAPAALYGSVGFKDIYNNLWLYGGANDTSGDNFNDLWRFIIDTSCTGPIPCPNGCAVTPPVIAGGSTSVCTYDSFSICIYPNLLPNLQSYAWMNGSNSGCIEAKATNTYYVNIIDDNGCTAKSNSVSIAASPGPSVTISAVHDTICPGDTAKICATSNFSSYYWSNNTTTQCMETQNAGPYFLIAGSNNGCAGLSNTVTIHIGQGPSVSISANPDTVCPGDSAKICPNTAFSSYTWSTNAVTQCIEAKNVGIYILTVSDNNGCTTQSNSFNILSGANCPAAPGCNTFHVNIGVVDTVSCTAGSGTLTAIANDTAGLSYMWSTGSTAISIHVAPAQTTTYTVTATSGNCTATASASVHSGAPAVSISTADTIFCSGDSTQICASAGLSSYAWNNNATGTCIEAKSSGVYDVTATNNSGCTVASNSIHVLVGQTPSVTLSASSDSICAGGSIQICPNGSFSSYTWSNNASTECITAQNVGAYSLTVTSNQGCSGTSNSFTIYSAQSPSVTISASPDSICAGHSAQICANANFATYTWSNNANTQCIQVPSVGVYALTVTNNPGCTAQSNFLRIYQGQSPSVTISASPDSICAGHSAQICPNANFSSYSWSTNVNSQCIEAQNVGVYGLTVTSNEGCTAQSNSLTIYAGQSLPVTISASPDSICPGESTQICPNTNFSSYGWSTHANTQCIETQNVGLYSLTVTDNEGCTAQSNSLSIYAGQSPPVSISASPDSICAGGSTQICPNANFSSYTWSNNASSQCLAAQNPGFYTLTVTDNQGCTAQSNSFRIYAGQSPSVNISAIPDTICAGSSAQICPNVNFAIYAWSNNANMQCIETQNTGLYSLTVTDNQGCTAQSNSVRIYAGQAPAVTISANTDTICSGDSAQICANSNFSSYTWSPALGGAGTNCIEVRNQGAYYLIASDNNGCTAQSNSVEITVGQVPSVTIIANPDTICSGDSAQICANSNFSSYMWNPAIGGTAANCIEVRNQGSYYLIAGINNGCTAQSNTVTINVGQAVTPTLTAVQDSLCTGDSTQICATQGFATYTWNPAIGGAAANCIHVQSPGAYSVAVTDNSGCTAQSNPIRITMLQPPTVTLNATSDSICSGDSTKICATSGFSIYVWNNNGTGSCIVAHNTGTYNVIVTDNHGCTAQSAPININVGNTLSATIIANTDSICPGDSAQICAGANFASYMWSNSASSQCLEAKNAGNYSVLVTDNAGCTAQSNSVSLTVQHIPTPTITASADSICPNDSAKLCAASGFANYAWSPPFGGQGACIEVKSAGNYHVVVSDNFGCTAQSGSVGIAVRQSPTALIKTSIDTICPGDSTQICSATTDALYKWNPASGGTMGKCVEAANAGDYYVTVTDNAGCTAESNHIGITTLPSPQVSISRIGDTLIANNAIGCQWYLNNEAISGATQNIYVAKTKGSYVVSVTDSDGCIANSSAIIYTGILDISESDNISIYPNPTSGSWQLTVGPALCGSAHVEILDANGRLVYKAEIKNTHSEIEAPFAGGVYLLRVVTGTDIIARKLVKL